jgi:hypothetical protein
MKSLSKALACSSLGEARLRGAELVSTDSGYLRPILGYS